MAETTSGLFDLVKTLTEMLGPSGYEDDVQDWLERRWREAGCETNRSRINNLFARVGGHGPKLLVAAHVDEISFRVKSIDDDGHLRLTSGTGGSELNAPHHAFVAQPCQVMTPKGNVPGTVGTVTGHVMTREKRADNSIDWPDIFLDIGARSRAEALSWGVHVGCPVVAEVPTRRVGHNIVGKAMDDRASLAIMTNWLETLDRDALQYELWFGSTVQEEVGLIGAGTVTGFDLAIAMEVGLAGDIPGVGNLQVPSRLGAGPLLGHKDAAVHYDRHILSRLTAAAEREGIPVQHLVFLQFSSDGKVFIGNDIPTAMLAYPTRYTHSPIETIDERDLQATLRLLDAFATTPW
ncbi:MAG: M42 family metallopeptidase [Truepera sp.]|nr:M42 family metallopeptidase [Truepera sp.]